MGKYLPTIKIIGTNTNKTTTEARKVETPILPTFTHPCSKINFPNG
jgi:hypothetical protein